MSNKNDMSASDFIYLDHCGTTPTSDAVRAEMLLYLQNETFGNPAARHHPAGSAAHECVENARAEIAAILNVHHDGVVFTSGATESNNLVIYGFLNRHRDRGCRIIVGASEHKSALEPALQAGSFGNSTVSTLPINRSTAVIDPDDLENLLKKSSSIPTLVVLMHCNNEVPARHPVEVVAKICRHYGAFFHCDAVQGVVREAIDFRHLGASSLTWTPHKLYGPKGVGVLLLDDIRPMRIQPLHRGGEQEKSLRPGTLHTMGIAMTAATLREHSKRRSDLVAHLRLSEDLFVKMLTDADIGFNLTVPLSPECPGIVNFWLANIEVQTLLASLGPVCVNRGASCTGAGGEKMSHVPGAMGLPIEIAANVIRASFGFAATVPQVKKAADIIVDVTRKLRARTGTSLQTRPV